MAERVKASRMQYVALKASFESIMNLEFGLSQDLIKLFNEAQRTTIQSLLDYGEVDRAWAEINSVISNFDLALENYSQTIYQRTKVAMDTGRLGTQSMLPFKMQVRITPGGFSDVIYNSLKDQIFKASQNTLSRLRGNVMENLSNSYKEGVGMREAADNLRSEFTNMKTHELRRVATTEILGAQNKGSYLTEQEAGVTYHQWWSSEDGRVRDSHRHMHGQITAVGATFSNGLRFPGDRAGPIKEWINCRCTLVPFIMPLGYMAPPLLTNFYPGDLVQIPHFEDATGMPYGTVEQVEPPKAWQRPEN